MISKLICASAHTYTHTHTTLILVYCLAAFRLIVHRRVAVNETSTQRVSFTKGRKKEPVEPQAGKEEVDDDEERKNK